MKFSVVTTPCAFLSIQILFILLTNEIAAAENEGKLDPTAAIGPSQSDQAKQLQSMQEMISKLSAQMSLMQSQDSVQKFEIEKLKSEMQTIQRDSEQKERQINNLADENQNLRQLLVKIMSSKNQSSGDSDVLDKDTSASDYRREFNQYMEETGGVTYIRWGRTTCEDPAYPLYTGYAASGSAYPASTSPGGASDIVCLHPQPQYADILTGKNYSNLFGIEYDFENLPFSTVNNGGARLKPHDMPCTVCHISSRSHQFMVPGRNTCPSGWVREYWGYLVSSDTARQKSSLICLDEAPEVVTGGAAQVYGGQIRPVEARCTAIPCPPYKTDYELSCAICSK